MVGSDGCQTVTGAAPWLWTASWTNRWSDRPVSGSNRWILSSGTWSVERVARADAILAVDDRDHDVLPPALTWMSSSLPRYSTTSALPWSVPAGPVADQVEVLGPDAHDRRWRR